MLQQDLEQFTGTKHWYKHPAGFTYTDGVKYLVDEAEAYWLLDAIASHQREVMKTDAAEFQIWELKVNSDKSCVLTCKGDGDWPERVHQTIEYTDFPLDYVKLWLTDNVLILPSEY